ncbi:MAG: hypothetical protein B0D92_07410, partial [Spirochaeta sp. LUC14_002_19_P3]
METRNVQTLCLSILTVLALGATLHFLRIVFLPLFIAGLLALMLTPLVQRMEKLRIPRIFGIFLVMGALLILFFVVGRMFYTSLQTFTEEFGDYQKRLVSILNGLWEQFNIPREFFPKFTWTRDIINRIIQVTGSFVVYWRTDAFSRTGLRLRRQAIWNGDHSKGWAGSILSEMFLF